MELCIQRIHAGILPQHVAVIKQEVAIRQYVAFKSPSHQSLHPLAETLEERVERRGEENAHERGREHARERGDADGLLGTRARPRGADERQDAAEEAPRRHLHGAEAVNSPIPVHFSSLIPRMLTFTLAISCLTTSNLP